MFFGGGGGGGGFGRRTFQDSFRCHSVSLLAAEQQRDPAQLEYSDKIILPPSCLEKLAHLEITYPMIFELTNPRYLQRRLHCGVLEFIAQEGMIYLPYWMMENMHLNEGDIVHMKSASIQKGSFVKLQPQTSDFIKISNPKAVLEQSLRSFSALTKGETFRILYNKKKYDIGVVEVRPEGRPFGPNEPEAVCIIEADVEVDFDAPADYVEPKRPSPQASPLSTSPLQKSPLAASLGAPKLDGDSSDEEDESKKAFNGAGFRLDGKAIKAPKVSPQGQGSMLQGGDVRVGVRIGSGGQVQGGAAAAAAPAPAPAPASDAAPGDYWSQFSGGGQKLR
tara:strand:+ start:193 stop:1197 length:1005 start_codon:yes stop_codon:yes gene_type:complete